MQVCRVEGAMDFSCALDGRARAEPVKCLVKVSWQEKRELQQVWGATNFLFYAWSIIIVESLEQF